MFWNNTWVLEKILVYQVKSIQFGEDYGKGIYETYYPSLEILQNS